MFSYVVGTPNILNSIFLVLQGGVLCPLLCRPDAAGQMGEESQEN